MVCCALCRYCVVCCFVVLFRVVLNGVVVVLHCVALCCNVL